MPVIMIGVITFLMTIIGNIIGNRVGLLLGKKAVFVAGVILLGLAFKELFNI